MDTAASHLSSVIYMFQLLFPDDYEDHSTQYDLLTSDPNGLSGLHAACTPFENFLLRILELWGNEAGFQRSSHYCFLEEAKWKSTVSNKQPVALTILSASQGYEDSQGIGMANSMSCWNWVQSWFTECPDSQARAHFPLNYFRQICFSPLFTERVFIETYYVQGSVPAR